jgi:DNA invertase Pin-like site-specific DNA recombinase
MKVLVAGRLSRKTDTDQTGFDSQEREAVRWAEQAGHEVIAVVADYRSGRSGLESRPNLRPWVTEPDRIAQYEGIVALKVDRLTRGNREETTKLETWAREHGKSLLIASTGVQFPSEGRDGIAWDLYLRMAHDEWLSISERYTRMGRNRREVGSAYGKAPWGYAIEKRDGKKAFVPTPEGRKWAAPVFDAVIKGNTLRDVAAWMDSEGVTALRSERAVWRLIGNPIYYGNRVNSGQLETEALVTYSTWQAANAAMKSRAKGGRGTAVYEKALLRPVCGNPGCDATGYHPSPMYHQTNPKKGLAYYRCHGRGTDGVENGWRGVPHGCGNMTRADYLDDYVISLVSGMTSPHTTRVFVPGDDRADEIGKLREAAMDAYRKGDKARFRELDARADALESLPSVAPHWEELESDQTRGQHFASLDYAGKRKYLAGWHVVYWDGEVDIVSAPLR